MSLVTDQAFNPSGNADIAEVKAAFASLQDIVERCCPETRRRSIALTNLETAAMYAVKSIAVGDD